MDSRKLWVNGLAPWLYIYVLYIKWFVVRSIKGCLIQLGQASNRTSQLSRQILLDLDQMYQLRAISLPQLDLSVGCIVIRVGRFRNL